MSDERSPTVDELFQRQLALQSEAAKVIMDLRLFDVLKSAGVPNPVGSLATGLMVWRDIDFTVVVDRLDLGVVIGLAGVLALHPRVRAIEFRNDSGHWNRDDAEYPDGLFLGVEYVGDEVWELDIWFVTEPERQPDIAHVRELSKRLTDEHRAAILAIKDAWHGRPEYGSSISSYDFCSAVLDEGVRTAEAFEQFMSHRSDG